MGNGAGGNQGGYGGGYMGGFGGMPQSAFIHWNSKVFDEKHGTDNKEYQYNGSTGGSVWVKTVRDYFIGKCPDAELMLKWAEQCPAEITNEDVDNCGYGTVVHPTVLSGHVWAWLKAVLREQAMTMFLTAPKRNGLAAWRALCKYVS